MMSDIDLIITQLKKNKTVFAGLLIDLSIKECIWKYNPKKWCLLEVICHLVDEEIEDFRTRVKTTLETPCVLPPPIDSVGWVKQRNYIDQNFQRKVKEFLTERTKSIAWLLTLENPKWNNSYHHQKSGTLSAHLFLSNWLAHDYLHIRQILNIKFEYLKHISGQKKNHAGI